MLEHRFQKKVKKDLDALPGCWHFTKEALALRGLPDLIGCLNGKFFALEVKRDHAEASRMTGRIVMQRYILKQIQMVGGFGEVVHPGNWERILEKLKAFGGPCRQTPCPPACDGEQHQ